MDRETYEKISKISSEISRLNDDISIIKDSRCLNDLEGLWIRVDDELFEQFKKSLLEQFEANRDKLDREFKSI